MKKRHVLRLLLAASATVAALALSPLASAVNPYVHVKLRPGGGSHVSGSALVSAKQDRTRVTLTLYGLAPKTIELRGSDARHTLFWRSDRTAYACEGAVLVPAGEGAAAGHDFTCTAPKALEAGHAQLVGLTHYIEDAELRLLSMTPER